MFEEHFTSKGVQFHRENVLLNLEAKESRDTDRVTKMHVHRTAVVFFGHLDLAVDLLEELKFVGMTIVN